MHRRIDSRLCLLKSGEWPSDKLDKETAMEHSELLNKLLDAVANNPSAISLKDVANLSVDELAIYMDFLKEQKSKTGSEFSKHVVKKAPTADPFKDIQDGEIEK